MRRLHLLYAVLCFSLFAISHYFPVENAIHTFRTPEAVFSYTNFEKLRHVIDGEESCMLVYSTGKSTYSVEFAGKRGDGYAILPQHGDRIVSQVNDKHGTIIVYHVEGTSDFYVIATFWKDAFFEVHNGSMQIDTEVVNVDSSGLFYFHVHNLSDSHYLLLDGEKITIYR